MSTRFRRVQTSNTPDDHGTVRLCINRGGALEAEKWGRPPLLTEKADSWPLQDC